MEKNLEKILENYSGAKDLPDSRDYTSEEIHGEVWASIQFPSSFFLDKAENLYQWTIWACTIFGSSNAYNEKIANAHNELATITENDAWKAWSECKNRWASDSGGFIFQSALQVLKDLNYIGGYTSLGISGSANVEKMKTALFVRKSGIASGLPSVNWRETLRLGEYVKGSYYGQWAHIFDIVGYDDNHCFTNGKLWGFFVKNSWGNGWEFWIAYVDIVDLYSQYEFLLTSEQEKFIEAKKRRKNAYLQKAYEKKIWNEERPKDLVTEAEIRIMLNRAIGLPEDYIWLRKMVHHLVNDKIVRGKILQVFEGRGYDKATDWEIAVMFTRAVLRNPKFSELCLSREQVAEVVWRDFFIGVFLQIFQKSIDFFKNLNIIPKCSW